jgi:hypothetical protein
MKRKIIIISALISTALFMAFVNGPGNGNIGHLQSSNAAPAGYAGDPAGGNKTCNTTGCHAGPSVQTQTGWITSDIPAQGYTPGSTYLITATAVAPGHSKFGFQVSSQTSAGAYKGTLASLSGQTALVGTTTKYITQTSSGTSGAGSRTWTFNWTAPAAGTGSVNFYGTFNITNSNNNTQGDTIYKSILTVNEATGVGLNEVSTSIKKCVISPVPANEFINIDVEFTKELAVTCKIIDFNGKMVKEISENNKTSHFEKRISLSELNLSAGLYFVNLYSENNMIHSKKIIIQQ